MPTLEWIGKKAVLNHHREVPFRLLHCDSELSVGDPDSGNLLVEGDNLLALKALLPHYAGKVKCIYIDPPYNTGNESWVYNDNVNSPEIRKWLGEVVGKEAEDLSRHDKWLCMMYPRLAILREFLRDDGALFASIDDTEVGGLRFLLDELFGPMNRVGVVVWRNVTDNNPTNISSEHEYVLCYARKKSSLPREWKSEDLAVKSRLQQIAREFMQQFPDRTVRQERYTAWFRENKSFLWPFDRYKFIDDGGIYTGSQSVHNPGKEGYRYDVPHPVTGLPCTQPLMGYRFPPETMQRLLGEGRILFGETHEKIIELKLYVQEYRAKLSSVFELDGRIGTNELKQIFPETKRPFDFPKPSALIAELLSFATSPGDLVLDSFAGSGTTGHACLTFGTSRNRRFLLVEQDARVSVELTRERLARVIMGRSVGGEEKSKGVEGLGGGFRYCVLGQPLFDEAGRIRDGVRYPDLAAHVYFTETGSPIPKRASGRTPLLGVHEGRAVYLLFNGVLGDKTPAGGNVLTRGVLDGLPSHDGPKVVYGEACRVGHERLRRDQVQFKQVPYEIRVG